MKTACVTELRLGALSAECSAEAAALSAQCSSVLRNPSALGAFESQCTQCRVLSAARLCVVWLSCCGAHLELLELLEIGLLPRSPASSTSLMDRRLCQAWS